MAAAPCALSSSRRRRRRLAVLPAVMAAALLLLACCAEGAAAGSGGRGLTRRRQLLRQRQVQYHLKRLNKAPLASIESPDGDIIDCVPISSQPAFDHPLLKNHTIQVPLSPAPPLPFFTASPPHVMMDANTQWRRAFQTRPAYHPEGLYDESKVASQKQRTQTITQMWHQNGLCQENTIPIRRTKKEDVFRASSIRRYGKKTHLSTPNPSSVDPAMLNENGHQHAIAYVEGDKYYGAKATINVWQPSIQQGNEFSLSQLWILGGSFGQDLNSIEAGWQVSPDLYGDNNTRLFTYWTSDAYQATGCYNLLCSGFIQTNNQIAMGASIFPISNYGGSQYDINILVWKVNYKRPSHADQIREWGQRNLYIHA
ncbi:hypothetical protein VPH35_036240 [Triticum aestivum]